MNDNEPKSEKWQAIVSDYQVSGLKKKTYCEQHGINIHTFGYWHAKFVPPSPKNFIPLIVNTDVKTASKIVSTQVYKLQLKNNLNFEIPASLPLDDLILLLKGLSEI